MELQNTLENKAKFFAQYWGQEVLRFEVVDNITPRAKSAFLELPSWALHKEYNYWSIQNGYLKLKPLSSITPQEQGFITSSKLCNSEKPIIKDKIGNYFEGDLYISDYLRSKGYALPYMGLSVEKQIEYGWIKLSE